MTKRSYPGGRALIGLALAAAVLATSGCTPPGVHRKVRGMVRDLAARELGPADKYEAFTSRDSMGDLKAGRLSYVWVRGVNVRPAPGYILDEVILEGRDVHVDRKAQTVRSAGTAVLTGWVGEANLASMLAETDTVKDPVVRVLENGVEVRGRMDLAGAIPVDVVALGKLSVKEPAGVTFPADRVTAGGVPMPFPFSRTIDFRQIYEPLILTGVSTEPGKVLLTGTIDWTKFGRRARQAANSTERGILDRP